MWFGVSSFVDKFPIFDQLFGFTIVSCISWISTISLLGEPVLSVCFNNQDVQCKRPVSVVPVWIGYLLHVVCIMFAFNLITWTLYKFHLLNSSANDSFENAVAICLPIITLVCYLIVLRLIVLCKVKSVTHFQSMIKFERVQTQKRGL